MNAVPDGTTIELTGTFDGHVHPRRKKLLKLTLPDLLHEFGGALVMVNLDPPVTTIPLALEYRGEIMTEIAANAAIDFDFLLTCYLTDEVSGEELIEGFRRKIWAAAKYMPHNGSTNTARALTKFRNGYPLYEKMEEAGMPLLLHAETVGDDIDPFNAEEIFIDKEMTSLRRHFPMLPVVIEHATTRAAADWVKWDEKAYATLTPQHLLFSRSRIFQHGLVSDGTFKRGSNPSMVCWPLLKREDPDRQALLQLIASGNERVGLGTDRAPHDWVNKACEDGCGGCYPGRLALAMYATAFEEVGSFGHFQDFACRNIPCGVYKLPLGTKKIRLVKCAAEPSVMPEKIGEVVPMMHGEKIPWRVELV